MINKRMPNAAEAVADIPDGRSIMVGGFGEAGTPDELLHALVTKAARISRSSQQLWQWRSGPRGPSESSPRHEGDCRSQDRQLDRLSGVVPRRIH